MTTCPNCGAPMTDRERFGAYPGAVSFTKHLVQAGPVSTEGVYGAEYQATCSCGWTGVYWPKRAEAQQDGIAHLRETRP